MGRAEDQIGECGWAEDQIGECGWAEKRPAEQCVHREAHRAAGKAERQVQPWLQELPSMEMA